MLERSAVGDVHVGKVEVDVRRNDTGQPPADLTEVVLTTNLGNFGSATGPQEVTLELVNGRAQAVLFPGTSQTASASTCNRSTDRPLGPAPPTGASGI